MYVTLDTSRTVADQVSELVDGEIVEVVLDRETINVLDPDPKRYPEHEPFFGQSLDWETARDLLNYTPGSGVDLYVKVRTQSTSYILYYKYYFLSRMG